MRRVTLTFALVAGCGASTPSTVTPGPGVAAATPQAAAVVETTPTRGHAIDGTLVEEARTAPRVEKIKLRVDAHGVLVKQSLYHFSANAIPEAVKATALQEFPKSKPVKYETERYGNAPHVFEVEVDTADGKHCEVSAERDGKLRYKECRIEPTALPAAVIKTVSELYGNGKILEAESKTGPGMDEFSVEVEVDGREFYLQIGADGTLLARFLRVPAVVEVPL